MKKVKILKDENNFINWKNNKIFCLDSKKVNINGNGEIKIYSNYITINDKLIVDIKREALDEYGLKYREIIRNINGIHEIGNKKLNMFLDSFNNNYISLEKSIEELEPLLEMLEKGEYHISYVNIFPMNYKNEFFWNIKNEEIIEYEIKDECIITMYLFSKATESHDFYNEERVNYYLDRYKKNISRPTPLIINTGNCFENIVIDGHHKIIASFLNEEPINAIMITKDSNYVVDSKTPVVGNKYDIKLINNHQSTVIKTINNISSKMKKTYKNNLDNNLFNNKIYKVDNRYPSLKNIIDIENLKSSIYNKDDENLDLKDRCNKLISLFLNNKNEAKKYALKIANIVEFDIDVELAFKILNNYKKDNEVKEFFQKYHESKFNEYYEDYKHNSKSEKYIPYRISLEYLDIKE